MKIQSPQYRGVESQGRASLRAVGGVAQAESGRGSAQKQVANYMAKVGSEFIERKENAEHAKAKTRTMLKIDAFEKQLGVREFYTAEEAKSLPAGAVNLKNTDGSPRNDIPAYEVYPYLLAQAQDKIIEEESKTISNPMLQENYIQLARGLASKTNLKTALNAARQQQDYLRKDARDTSMQLAIQGKIFAAEKIIEDNDFSALETKTLIRELREVNEWESDTRILKTLDLKAIMPRYDQLRSANYGKAKGETMGPGKSSGPYNVRADLKRFEGMIGSVRGANNNANYLRYQEAIRSADDGNFDTNWLYNKGQQIAIIKNDPSLTANQKNILVMKAGNAFYAGKVRNETRLTPLENDMKARDANALLLKSIPADLHDEQVAINTAQTEAIKEKLDMIKTNAAGYFQMYSPALRVLSDALRDPERQKNPASMKSAMYSYLFVLRNEQEQMGLTPEEVNFLTPQYINKFKEIASSVNKDPLGVTKLVGQMELLREQYPNEWPAIYGQLIREKALKPEHIMGDIVKDSSMRIQYIQAIESQGEMQKTPFYKTNIKRAKADVARATLLLKSTLFTGGSTPTVAEGLSMGEQVNAFETGLTQMLLSEGYRTNIYNPARASELVDKVIDDNWDIYEGVRIPKGKAWDNDNVKKALLYFRMRTSNFKISPDLKFVGQPLVDLSAEDNQRKLRGQFTSFSTPSTNTIEKGIIFKWSSGDPVLVMRKGRAVPLNISFETLDTYGHERTNRPQYRMELN